MGRIDPANITATMLAETRRRLFFDLLKRRGALPIRGLKTLGDAGWEWRPKSLVEVGDVKPRGVGGGVGKDETEMAEHSPEPWTVRHVAQEYRGDDYQILNAFGVVIGQTCEEWAENLGGARRDAERIVACVNFCRQFKTDWLKGKETVPLEGSEMVSGREPLERYVGLGQIPNLLGLIPVRDTTGLEKAVATTEDKVDDSTATA